MLSLNLFGSATLSLDDRPVHGRAAHKRRLAVLAVLAGARYRPIGRERLVSLIWPDMPAEKARPNLSEALHVLRKDLAADELFVSTGDEVGLNRALIRCDVVEFEEAVEAGEPERAVALYRGPFLDGFYVADAADFQRWADEERHRLERVYGKALEQLAEKCEREGDHPGAVGWWRKLAAHDRYSSRVALRLMRALEAAGERAAAIQHAKVHATLVREDLGIEPDPEVLAYAERLKAELAAPSPKPESHEPEPPAGPAREEKPDIETGSHQTRQDETGLQSESGDVIVAAPPEPSEPPAPVRRRTATVWCADVVGFLELADGRNEVGADLLEVLQNIARDEVRLAGGHLVEVIEEGRVRDEGVVAEFHDSRAAVRAALRLVPAFEKRMRETGVQATLQVGVHRGELSTTDDGDVYGDTIEGVLELKRQAEPGRVLATAEVRQRLRNAPEMRIAEHGTIQLPGRDLPTEVFEVQVERPAVPVRPTPPPDEQPRKRGRREWVAAAAAGIFVLMLLGTLLRWLQPGGVAQPPVPPPPSPNRIAVLYLEDHSPDGSLSHIAAGFTDQLIDQLARVEALDVVPRNGVRPFRNSTLPLDSVAHILRAGTLIEGSLQQSDGRIRLTVRVVDVSEQVNLESETLERPVGEVFALQDDFAQHVARFLRANLGEKVNLERRSGDTRNSEALKLVYRAEQLREEADTIDLAGRHAADSPYAIRVLARADTLLERAERLDRQWVEPKVLRAWVAMDRYDQAKADEKEALCRLAIRHADRALEVEPDDPGAREVRGLATWRLAHAVAPSDPAAGDTLVAAAERDLRAATDADPLRAMAWNTLNQMLRTRGEFMAAELAARRAIQADAYLDTEDVVIDRQFYSALMLAEYPRARRHCAEGGERYPTHRRFVQCRLTLLALDPSEQPDAELAWKLARELNALDPPDKGAATGRPYWAVYRDMKVAMVLARAGQGDSARAVMARARAEAERNETHTSLLYDEALVWAALGDRAAALRALESYLAASPLERGLAARDPALRALHGDRAFSRLIRSRTSGPRRLAAQP